MATRLLIDIGNRLLERREQMGLTQKEAARMLGISETHYGELERGNKRLTVERMIQINELMDIDLTWLLTGKVVTPHFMAELYNGCDPDKRELLDHMVQELHKLCKRR